MTDEWKARAEAAERNLAHVRGDWESALRRQRALESELATLRAENERLRLDAEPGTPDEGESDLSAALARVEHETNRADTAESRLVTAVGLLGRVQKVYTPHPKLREDINDFLANPPAAPAQYVSKVTGAPLYPVEPAAPTRTEAGRVTFSTVQGQTLSSCTMADVEVLKATDAVPTERARYWAENATDPAARDVWRAVLLRRKDET